MNKSMAGLPRLVALYFLCLIFFLYAQRAVEVVSDIAEEPLVDTQQDLNYEPVNYEVFTLSFIAVDRAEIIDA